MPRHLEIFAKTIYGEARGEPYLGQVAVAHVIRTRTFRPRRFGDGYEGVCLREKQFSCWNEGDPNRKLLENVSLFELPMIRAMGIAALVMIGELSDPTAGADHYFATSIDPPRWARDMDVKAVIGHHRFLEERV